MIDELRGPGMDAGQLVRKPAGQKHAPGAGRPTPSDPTPRGVGPELRGRLSAVAGDLETLLQELSGRQSRGSSDTVDLQRSINAAQVALQNILSAEPETPSAPPGAPPAHDLDRQNVLQLLDHE